MRSGLSLAVVALIAIGPSAALAQTPQATTGVPVATSSEVGTGAGEAPAGIENGEPALAQDEAVPESDEGLEDRSEEESTVKSDDAAEASRCSVRVEVSAGDSGSSVVSSSYSSSSGSPSGTGCSVSSEVSGAAETGEVTCAASVTVDGEVVAEERQTGKTCRVILEYP